MKEFTVTIPCKRVTRKYLLSRYGEQIHLSYTDDFLDMILTKLSTQPIKYAPIDELKQSLKLYTEKISFILPFDAFYRVSTTPTDQQIFRINRYIENRFYSELFYWVMLRYQPNKRRIINVAIEKFMEYHKIELDNDISYDAVKQGFFRFRKKYMDGNVPLFLRA